jgi:UMF1 family MFS transporter
VLIAVPEIARQPRPDRTGFFASYRVLFRDLAVLHRTDRRTWYFLGASALFRDGLNAVFAFGAVLAVTVYDVAPADVLLFGISANIVSATGALVAGRFDDRWGPKLIIVISLIGTLIAGTLLLLLSGPAAFWVFGSILALFVGPAQSSSRTFLARLASAGHEGQLFPSSRRPCSACSHTSSAPTAPASWEFCWFSPPVWPPSGPSNHRIVRNTAPCPGSDVDRSTWAELSDNLDPAPG